MPTLRTRRIGVVASVVIVALTLLGPPGYPMRSTTNAPSAHCHVTDGIFTTCDDGNVEWSDIPATEFAARQAFLYADQADLIPGQGVPGLPYDTFMLLYDECGRTTPLGPNEYFLVSFDTVETYGSGTEHFERYSIRVFTDGTIIFLEDGEVQRDSAGRARVREIEGQTGKAGFGQSPQCPFDHLVVEYQIDLDAAGGHSYSPDPLFWGGTPPEVPPIARDDDADLGDDARQAIDILANDNDPDGSIVPSTVVVQEQPEHGSIHIGSSGVATYEKDPDFEDTDSFAYTVQDDDGAQSNTATVTVVGNCPTDLSIPVTLPPTTGTGVQLSLLKGYRVSYDPLNLTFTSRPASPSAYCSLDSDAGVLRVRLTCLGTLADCPDLFPQNIPVMVATSTATASLDFFRPGTVTAPPVCDFVPLGNSNNCMLNSPSSSGIMVRWQSPGFTIRDAFFDITLHNTGPLTFWVNLSGVSSPRAPLADKVARAETFIHTTLVSHLSAVDRFSIIQDPPAEILVTDQGGRRTGRTTSGDLVNEIPGSVYSTSAAGASMVLILEPAPSEYEVNVHGAVGESFSLSMAVIDLYGDVSIPEISERRVTGEIEAGGNTFFFVVPVEQRAPLLREAIRPGFNAVELPGNDDESAGPVPLGFEVNFFGRTFSEAFVNNNGNLTFDQGLSIFTPFDLSTTERAIIAPFFADVDTTARSATLRYGTGTIAGRPAFGATWPGVGCFNPDGAPEVPPRNKFQVVLIDRNDIGPGDFDIEFNYDQIQWEAGTASGADTECRGGSAARIGFAKGTSEPGTFFELPGSGIPGTFLDSNGDGTALIHNKRDSIQLGRYRFAVRNGDPQTGDADGDTVPDDMDNCPHTPNADQRDTNLDGVGDVCAPAARLHSTAGFLQARLDGMTSAETTGSTLGEEPGLLDRLIRIVEFRLDAGLATSASPLTANLVRSLVRMGLVAPGDADALIAAVLQNVDLPPSASPSFSVAPSPSPSPGGELGRTGFRLIPLAITGAILVAGGVLLLLISRRRRRDVTRS